MIGAFTSIVPPLISASVPVRDFGHSWQLNRALWDQPGRAEWMGGGNPAPGLHSVCLHPDRPDEVMVAVSCGGVWHSADAGATWALRTRGMKAAYMPPEEAENPNVQDPHRIQRCTAQPHVLWCQHHGGIWRSTDGGLTWSKRFSSYTGGYEYPVHSLAVSPGAPNTMYAGVSYWGVFRSLDGGASWTRVTSGLPTTDVARIQVTVAPTDPNRVYAAIAAVNGNVRGLYTSANAGTTWTLIAPTATAAAWNCNTQCWYDLTVAASPTTADNVYVGGVTITKYTGNGLSSAVVLNPQTGGGVGVHWDIHVLTFDAAKRLWIGTDGGVYRWDDQSQPAVNLNKTLGLTQFYPGISGSTGGYLCLLYTSPSPRDGLLSRMPSSA